MENQHKIGLVLEGGAMRGMFSAGVIDVLMENNVHIDEIVGVSAGAAFGCNFKSRQIGRALRYNKLLARDWRMCSLRSWLLTGDLFGAKFAYHTVPETIDPFDCSTYDANPLGFTVVTTDVETGKPVYRRLDKAGHDCFDWIRASASMPVCSRIVKLDGHQLLDGGITDSIPLEYIENQGIMRNIVVLTQPAGYCKRPTKPLWLMRCVYWRRPNLIKALKNRHIMYNAQLDYVARAEAAGRAFVIRPPEPLPIGHLSHDPNEMQRVYDIGRATALRLLPSFLNFLH